MEFLVGLCLNNFLWIQKCCVRISPKEKKFKTHFLFIKSSQWSSQPPVSMNNEASLSVCAVLLSQNSSVRVFETFPLTQPSKGVWGQSHSSPHPCSEMVLQTQGCSSPLCPSPCSPVVIFSGKKKRWRERQLASNDTSKPKGAGDGLDLQGLSFTTWQRQNKNWCLWAAQIVLRSGAPPWFDPWSPDSLRSPVPF